MLSSTALLPSLTMPSMGIRSRDARQPSRGQESGDRRFLLRLIGRAIDGGGRGQGEECRTACAARLLAIDSSQCQR